MAKCPECGADWSTEEGEDEFCMECGHEPSVEERVGMMSLADGSGGGSPLANFVVGRVESVEEIPKKDKLSESPRAPPRMRHAALATDATACLAYRAQRRLGSSSPPTKMPSPFPW